MGRIRADTSAGGRGRGTASKILTSHGSLALQKRRARSRRLLPNRQQPPRHCDSAVFTLFDFSAEDDPEDYQRLVGDPATDLSQ